MKTAVAEVIQKLVARFDRNRQVLLLQAVHDVTDSWKYLQMVFPLITNSSRKFEKRKNIHTDWVKNEGRNLVWIKQAVSSLDKMQFWKKYMQHCNKSKTVHKNYYFFFFNRKWKKWLRLLSLSFKMNGSKNILFHNVN